MDEIKTHMLTLALFAGLIVFILLCILTKGILLLVVFGLVLLGIIYFMLYDLADDIRHHGW
jgi:hypothetical protein